MEVSPLAGKPADPSILINVDKLASAYYAGQPDPSVPAQRVAFGTSGHRGCSLDNSFNEAHILAITQAICLYRKQQGIDGPLYIGFDTHALSGPAFRTALEVLAGNGVDVMVDAANGYTPTPVISHAILSYNRGRKRGLADGIVITPSHNPPRFGGFKIRSSTWRTRGHSRNPLDSGACQRSDCGRSPGSGEDSARASARSFDNPQT